MAAIKISHPTPEATVLATEKAPPASGERVESRSPNTLSSSNEMTGGSKGGSENV